MLRRTRSRTGTREEKTRNDDNFDCMDYSIIMDSDGDDRTLENVEGNASRPNRESDGTNLDELHGIPYELTIIRLGTDPLGRDFILAKHSAYDDEQVG